MGLSENARRKRNEKKKNKKNGAKKFGSGSAVNADGTCSSSSSATQRRLIGALSFEEQSQLDQSQGDQAAKCAQESAKNQGTPNICQKIAAYVLHAPKKLDGACAPGAPKKLSLFNQEPLVEYTTLSSHEEEAKKMQQSGLPTAFGTKKDPINSLKECEVESEIPKDKLGIRLMVTPYLFCKYTNKFAMKYMKENGWEKGTGIGKNSDGIIYPLEQTTRRDKETSGLGSFLSESASHSESGKSL